MRPQHTQTTDPQPQTTKTTHNACESLQCEERPGNPSYMHEGKNEKKPWQSLVSRGSGARSPTEVPLDHSPLPSQLRCTPGDLNTESGRAQ